MTDFEIMQRAKTYIDKMANGIDPITDQPVREEDLINNVRISRCLFFVSDVLRRVIENGGAIPKPKKRKEAFRLTDEQLAHFRFSDDPISISEITKRFNELLSDEECVQLKHTQLTSWLVALGALEIVTIANGKTKKEPTKTGAALGIFTEERIGMNGSYVVVLYKREAQQFIVDHLSEILAKNEQKQEIPGAQ